MTGIPTATEIARDAAKAEHERLDKRADHILATKRGKEKAKARREKEAHKRWLAKKKNT